MAYKNTKRAYYGNMGEISDMCSPFIITTITVIIIIVSIFVSNYASSFKMFAYSSNISTTPSSFKNSIDNGMISSSALRLLRDAAIMRMHNTTGMVSYVGEVNVSNLQRPLFKPLIGINSQESYLTRDFAAYKVAKNQSEIIKPSTRVFEVKLPSASRYSKNSLQNGQWPVSSRTNLNTSSIISAKFDGLAQNCCIPPDVQVAAGTKYVVEMVNLDEAIYTKNRTLLKSFGLKFLFNPTVKGSQELHVSMSDPVLLFDNASRRWFASISDMTAHSIRVAVSEADDPAGVWRIYNFPFEIRPNNCSDQPFIGVSEDKFIVTVNNWGNDCNWRSDNEPPEFRGVQFIVADKIDLLTGSGSVGSVQSESDLSYFSLHPIITLSPTPTLLVATVGDFNHNNVQVLYIDGPLYNLRIRIMSYAIQDTHVAPDGIQPTAQSTIQITTQEPKVSTGDARIEGAIWYQGKLWLTFNDGCFIIADTKSRSCVRLIQIDTIINKVIQDFDIGAIGSSLYYPAISTDGGGNLGIIFGYSSHSTYPSISVSTQSSNDEHNSIKEPQSLKLGTANELTNRYGDYFAASSDPLSDSIIWVAGEYHATATWSTYIGELYTGTLS